MDIKTLAIQERAKRELEKRYKEQRESLVAFISYFFEHEKGKSFDSNWHYEVIAEALVKVLNGEITRLMINIPPGSGKTEIITKCFPVHALGLNPHLHIIATGYSTNLTQTYGSEARDYYQSSTFRKVFPRAPKLRTDTNAKGLWKNEAGGQYLATGTGGAITGNRANIFIIDDPIKPDEAATSEVTRTGINNWYENTVLSRLFNPLTDAVIIIMQRTHDDDLCGYLLGKMEDGTGEQWTHLCLPAIATEDEPFRKEGEALQKNRYPIEALSKLRLSMGDSNFSSQYQQNPVDKESQEFHEEWFRYYENAPAKGRIFTAVDPAFKKGDENDYSSIITGKFVDDQLYVLEYTVGRYDPGELNDKIVYHVNKWDPEKVGIEAYQAQTIIGFTLKNHLQKMGKYVSVEEIKQTGDKETKIRKLIPLYRNGLIYHKRWMEDGKEVSLEAQLKRFPKGKHDDVIDSLQMLYDLYALQPNVNLEKHEINIEYDHYGRPVIR